MISGDEVIAWRQSNRLSRREMVNQLGAPWTESKLNNVEHGRRPMKPDELEAMQRLMSGGGPAPAPSPTPAAPVQSKTTYTSVSDPDRDLAIRLVTDVKERLGGKPAPPFGLPSMYRVDACPPGDIPRWIHWARRVDAWLDQAGVPRIDRGVIYPIDEEFEEPMFLDAASEAPTTPAPTAPAPVIPEPDLRPGEALPTFTAPPPLEERLAEILPLPTNYQPEPQPTGPVGIEALYDGKMRLISNSEFQTFKHCRRRWWLGWYRGLKLKAEKMTGHAPLGTRIHEALSHYYVPGDSPGQRPIDALEDILKRDEAALVKTMANADGDLLISTLADFKKEADLARAMIEGYEQWLEETGIDQHYEVIEPEVTLTALIHAAANFKFTLTGQLDVRVRRVHDGVNLLMDHKTVGDFVSPRLKLQLDEQMKTYLLLEELNKQDGDRVEGALYNMLRRVKRTATAKPPFYERLEVIHSPKVIDNFHERLKGEGLTVNVVERCLNDNVNHQIIAFPSPGSDCRWRCEFTALCSMLDDDSRAEDFISEHYVQVNPTAYRDAKKRQEEM